ncbi:MAG: carboxylate-amine ligase [Solirubrobacteraceae bacterium]
MNAQPPLDGPALCALFDAPRAVTFGIEEEVLLLDRRTLQPLPRAAQLLALMDGDPRYKLELPAAQLEIVTPARASLAELEEDLTAARADLARALHPQAVLLGAGVHPASPAEAELNDGAHYSAVAGAYGRVARRQLVCGLHLHARISGASRALAVYNALREHLPELAALAANAPLYEGCDTGFSSVRPLLAGMLPRQGVPPAYTGWDEFAADLRWGAAAGRLNRLLGWWWELRPHAELGTIEIRVPDAQSLSADTTAVAAVAAALVVRLAERHDAGELPAPAASWRIAENRWLAARNGLHGETIDVRTGEARPTRERLAELLEQLGPAAARIGAARQLERARRLAESNGAEEQRRLFARGGWQAVVGELSGRFAEPPGDQGSG